MADEEFFYWIFQFHQLNSNDFEMEGKIKIKFKLPIKFFLTGLQTLE